MDTRIVSIGVYQKRSSAKNTLSLSVFMVDHRWPFISFIFEKLLSDSAFEAGRTNINSIILQSSLNRLKT